MGRRAADSPIERIVARRLAHLRVHHVRQFRIGPYRADFYIPKFDLVVECDGEAWHRGSAEQVARDRARDAFMRERGYHVRRLTGREIVRTNGAAVDYHVSGDPKRPHPKPGPDAVAVVRRGDEDA